MVGNRRYTLIPSFNNRSNVDPREGAKLDHILK